jgi:alpha,alpha-trehalase
VKRLLLPNRPTSASCWWNPVCRYWDNRAAPRAESYREDVLLGQSLPEAKREELYRNIRAACESGWDFSSRWFDDNSTLATINTTSIIPVDLNALLYNLETTLAEGFASQGNQAKSADYQNKALTRKNALLRYCWNEEKGYFYDYQFRRKQQTGALTLAGMYPFYFGMADPAQAGKAASALEKHLLLAGGLVTTLNRTHQQWDSPNGWPPLQWMAIGGLRRYQQDSLANNIKSRWIRLNEGVFNQTGKMMEKYNVTDLSLKAGGGEYPLQDGFGWTNGVVLALIREKVSLAPARNK